MRQPSINKDGNSQGVVSVILVMPQFLDRFPRVAEGASGAGFWKGLLTAMIELGALIGECFSRVAAISGPF